MLPCNVIVQEAGDGQVELAAIDPATSMQAVDNSALREIAETIRGKLAAAIQSA